MENQQMTKEQVIEATISVLSNISVPVAKKKEIADPIEGCIQNLAIVLQMCEAERQATEQAAAERELENQGATPEELGIEPDQDRAPDPIPLFGEEGGEPDGRNADSE